MRKIGGAGSEKNHLVTLLDEYGENSVDGSHLCLVLSLMGPNLATGAQLFGNKKERYGRYPLRLLKRLSFQILKGLDILHSHNICHAGRHVTFMFLFFKIFLLNCPLDLQPGNILFSLPFSQTMLEEIKRKHAVTYTDSLFDQTTPLSLNLERLMLDWLRTQPAENLTVRVSDFGACKAFSRSLRQSS